MALTANTGLPVFDPSGSGESRVVLAASVRWEEHQCERLGPGTCEAGKKSWSRDNLACADGVMSGVGSSNGFSGDRSRGEFEAFARRAAPSLLRSAFLLCGDRGHAEDLLQVTLWRTAQRWVLAREAPEAYAYRVLVNLSRDRRRGQRRRVSEWLGSDDRVAVEVDHGERFAQRDVMGRAVRRLPDRQREVIVLRFFLDLSIAQTAAALGSSEGTVKSHTARALARMREVLGESHAGSLNVAAEVANAE
jgi:RNA polymerase sigma-70 factor (sigma-E family)